MSLIKVIKALSDETRLRILNLLRYGELCVCEIETILGITQSNVSRHLNRLMYANIVDFYKKAQYVYYRINEDTLKKYSFIRDILENELIKEELYKADLERLRQYRESKLSCDDLRRNKVYFEKESQNLFVEEDKGL
ncbi:ArsR family transcriptional regulator [Caldicoprobacter guelmensis]|uniref:ArsR/SmtB family transcription factor n=1 Tax=Caldicoprobacter guelmensis TaxID=1170224 RepID=UPI0019567D29|nr:metalloregulator ArsR/SmtB family transcription factor [Caldicoprobacter guelmensis]MBM7582788.1 ArsR family transcriptional regulator [Caldicoprobacter guelmensis]